MNADILRRAGIDYDRGVKRFVGRSQLYEKALAKFPRDGAFARIRDAYEADDRERLYDGAHELKGMCGNIALTALYEASDAMVRLLRDGACPRAALDDSYRRLAKEYDIVYQAVVAAMEGSV